MRVPPLPDQARWPLCGIWQAPANRDLPVYWCHLMERGPPQERVPLPSEGFGATGRMKGRSSGRFSARAKPAPPRSRARARMSRAFTTRTFMTARTSPNGVSSCRPPGVFASFPRDGSVQKLRTRPGWIGLDSLRLRASAAAVVPLLSSSENEVHVVRLVAPPLRLNPRAGFCDGRDCRILGPTLAQEHARACPDAVYRPPAEQGDIVRVVTGLKASTILLIDGVFGESPGCPPQGRSSGRSIAASASMARPAWVPCAPRRLHAFGMRGHGLIYRWYRATPLADDDEVAVAMMPAELGS